MAETGTVGKRFAARGRWLVMAVVMSLPWLTGCGASRGPVEELRPLLESLGNPTDSAAGLSADLYRLLDEPSRTALKERARVMSEKAGVAVDPAHVLQTRGFTAAVRVTQVELVEATDDEAKLKVYFGALEPLGESEPKADEGRVAAGRAVFAPIELSARREADGWRLSMGELAALVARVGVTVDTVDAEGRP